MMPFSSKSSVTCRGISKTWAEGTDREHEALRDINVEIEPGEFVAFLGPSGCGKSTLLYLVAGLEPASSGEIWSFDDRVTGPSPDRSLIFQETSLFPWLTVWQNVSFGLGIRGADRQERRALRKMPSNASGSRPPSTNVPTSCRAVCATRGGGPGLPCAPRYC
jgi:NitT/TauT family transport system ATP-binding protein